MSKLCKLFLCQQGKIHRFPSLESFIDKYENYNTTVKMVFLVYDRR